MFELSLLLPCFAYLTHSLGNVINKSFIPDDEKISIDFTENITKYLGMAMLPYRDKHSIAIAKNNSILKKIDTTGINVYLFGLSLIGKHIELHDKIFNTDYLQDTILFLQDEAIESIGKEKTNKTFDAADNFLAMLSVKLNYRN